MAQCTAHNRAGGQCRRSAIPGGTVCHNHGGASPQVKAAAAERVATERAAGVLAKLGDAKPIDDPLHELLVIGGKSKQLMAALEGAVVKLETIGYENANGGEQTRAELAAYERALDRCAKVLAEIVRLDIWDRLAKVEERQVALFAQALDAALAEAGLADRAPEVRGNVARHLRVVAG